MSLESVNRVSKGPSRFAIAGERFAALTTARAVAASNKIFISDLIRWRIEGRPASTAQPRVDGNRLQVPSPLSVYLESPAEIPVPVITMLSPHRSH